jgi:hypothetical protein
MKPNIYECKICQEHHCEHDFPDESVHELSPIFNTHQIVLQPPPLKNPSPKSGEKAANGHALVKIHEKPSSSQQAEEKDKN